MQKDGVKTLIQRIKDKSSSIVETKGAELNASSKDVLGRGAMASIFPRKSFGERNKIAKTWTD